MFFLPLIIKINKTNIFESPHRQSYHFVNWRCKNLSSLGSPLPLFIISKPKKECWQFKTLVVPPALTQFVDVWFHLHVVW